MQDDGFDWLLLWMSLGLQVVLILLTLVHVLLLPGWPGRYLH